MVKRGVIKIMCTLIVAAGCGKVVDDDDASADARADVVDASSDFAVDASDDSWPDVPPSSCDDVGRYPGRAACCNSSYCAGGCEYDACYCAGTVGCIWPAICCSEPPGCVGVEACTAW